MTALSYALETLSKIEINYVTLEGHGREEIEDENGEILDISGTVGWFTTMYPVRLEINKTNLNESILNINRELENMPNKGVGYGPIIGYVNEHTLPYVSFNYLGHLDAHTSAKNLNNWHLTDGISGNETSENINFSKATNSFISINGHCIKGKIQFNINSIYTDEITEKFANVFKSKLSEIVAKRNRFLEYLIENVNLDYFSNDFNDPFVIFNKNAKKCLFIFPPGSGGAESFFNNIVAKLSTSDYKLVLFNNFLLHLKSKSLENLATYEKLASFYIKYIKQLDPIGPYNFFGWSHGGTLSFEIARQLACMNDRVDNVLILDSFFNLKKAFNEINKTINEELYGNINYIYNPSIHDTEILNKTNLTLFKANKYDVLDFIEGHQDFYKYYVNSKSNNLETITNCNVRLVNFDATHTNWTTNENELEKIINEIKKC